MSEYKKSYYILFNTITDAIDAMERGFNGAAKLMLIEAQDKAVDAFISYGEDEVEISQQQEA